MHFLKLGVGPRRSAARLEGALSALSATRILVTGYAGALDPDLKQGDLIVVDRADLLAGGPSGISLDEIGLDGSWILSGAAEVLALALGAGLPVRQGAALTSHCLIGDPDQKRVLFRRFGASIVDMETAELARVASLHAVPLSCVRAVSDESLDDFLPSTPYDPDARPFRLAAQILTSGGWLHRYGQWRERSLSARRSLSRFLACFLEKGT